MVGVSVGGKVALGWIVADESGVGRAVEAGCAGAAQAAVTSSSARRPRMPRVSGEKCRERGSGGVGCIGQFYYRAPI